MPGEYILPKPKPEDVELVLIDAPYWWWPFPSKPLPKDERDAFLVQPGKPFAVSMQWLNNKFHIDIEFDIKFSYNQVGQVRSTMTIGHNRWIVFKEVNPGTTFSFVSTVQAVGHEAIEVHGVIRVVERSP